MEQTLGKRIVHHRKKLGLTQDQLAEQLGVTAQAVSKWENDLSCPDISMLPKLAAIFGITTDALLGTESDTPARDVEVVTPEEAEPEDTRDQKGKWQFSWNSGRKNGLGFALLVLAVGGQLLAARLLDRDIGFWSAAWTSAFFVFGFTGLLHKFGFWKLGAMLVGTYFILDNWQLLPFTLGSELVLPIILLLFGLSLLVDILKKPKKPHFKVTHKGKKRSDYHVDGETVTYSASFGDSIQRIDIPRLSGGDISTSFGDYTVDFSGVEAVTADCLLDISCSFGELTLLIPRKFAAKPSTSTSFAEFCVSGHPDPDAQSVIALDVSVSFGQITVRYI